MQSNSKQEYKEFTGEVRDQLGLAFSVSIGYYPNNHNPSIESYELEGDNVSREELVERFGEEQIHILEVDLD